MRVVHCIPVGIEPCDLYAARAVLEEEVAQFLTQTQNDLSCFAVGLDRFPFLPIFGLYKVKPEFSQFIKPIKTGLDYELAAGEASQVGGLDSVAAQKIGVVSKKTSRSPAQRPSSSKAERSRELAARLAFCTQQNRPHATERLRFEGGGNRASEFDAIARAAVAYNGHCSFSRNLIDGIDADVKRELNLSRFRRTGLVGSKLKPRPF